MIKFFECDHRTRTPIIVFIHQSLVYIVIVDECKYYILKKLLPVKKYNIIIRVQVDAYI